MWVRVILPLCIVQSRAKSYVTWFLCCFEYTGKSAVRFQMPDSNRIAGRVYVLFWEQLRCAYNTVNHFRAWNIKIVDIYPMIHFKYLLHFAIIFLKFDIFYIYSYNVRFKILSKGNRSLIIFDILIKIFFLRTQSKKICLNWLKYWIRHADCILLHLDWDLNCFRKKPYSNEKGISSSTL